MSDSSGRIVRAKCLLGSRDPFKRDTANPGTWATEGTYRLFSLYKSDTACRSTRSTTSTILTHEWPTTERERVPRRNLAQKLRLNVRRTRYPASRRSSARCCARSRAASTAAAVKRCARESCRTCAPTHVSLPCSSRCSLMNGRQTGTGNRTLFLIRNF